MWLPFAAVTGVVLDRIFGEVRCLHPLVGFGNLASCVERRFNRAQSKPVLGRAIGVASWALIVLPWVLIAYFIKDTNIVGWVCQAIMLYFAIGSKSLAQHATRVAKDLAAGDLPAAREHVGWIVSRNTAELDETGVAKACVESTLENGNDAIFGALFWFILFGGAGAVLYRLANTLDAMWGYRTDRLRYFGWAAARIDDVLNYIPARLTATSYALFGQTRRALKCWRQQAPVWDSPNAGPVMSSGAGSLGIELGGAAYYHGALEERPALGEGRPPVGGDILRALNLVRRSIMLWLFVFLMVGVAGA